MSTPPVAILLVEDSTADAVLMKKELADSPLGPFAIVHARRLVDAIEHLTAARFDAVMLDLGLPDSQGISTLRELQKHARHDIPIVVLTGLDDDALGLKSVQEGAADYLAKGTAADGWRARSVRYAIERKRADEAFVVSQQRLALAVGAAKMGIFDWNLHTGEVNRFHNSSHLFGLEPHEMEPTFEGFRKCLHPDDRAEVEARVQQAFAKHEEYLFECRTVWPDETVHWIEARGKVFYDAGDKPMRVLGTVMDISKRKADEAAAKIRDAEMAHLSRVTTMGQMASGLAHELNQPLAAILNYAEVCVHNLESPAGSTATAKNAAIEVMHETRRAGAIISRMRSFVRKQQPDIQAMDINHLVMTSIQLLEFEFRQRKIRPRFEMGDDLPKALCDAVQIEQVLVNLILNAMDSMGEQSAGGSGISVRTALHEQDSVEVSVTDCGSGMSAEALARLFEPFFTTKAKGLGMGLNICRSIIESHGGRLRASANPTGGIRFCFTLPISKSGGLNAAG
jgi:signal transduction histidine kinase